MVFLVPDSVMTLNGVTVKEHLLTKHNPNGISLPQKRTGSCAGVTIHNTDIINAAKGTTMAEQYTRSTFNGNMKDVRVHYYVDSVEAWQNFPLDYQNWTCGSKYRKNGVLVPEPEANGSEVGNRRTIAIECIMGGLKGYEKAEDNAARLAAYLLFKNGLSIDFLYSHNYWVNLRRGVKGSRDYLNTAFDNYKGCPIFIRPHWIEFKQTVQGYMNAFDGTTSSSAPTDSAGSFKVKVIDKELNIRAGAGVKNKIVGTITDCGIYTIVETVRINNTVWGKLKSGAGWINTSEPYCKKV